MDDKVLLVKLPAKKRAKVTSPLLAEALAIGKLQAPLEEALASLSDQFLEAALNDMESGAAGKAALLVLAVSRACQEMGTDKVQVRRTDLLRWCCCMSFLLNLEHLRRAGVIQSIQAEPISEPNSVLAFS
jgi:hypothetical protein